MSIFKKSVALLLAVCMMCSIVPITASATDTEDITSDSVADMIDTFDVKKTSEDEISVMSLTMGTKPDDGTTTGNPFVMGTGGSNSFRIPAMVTLNGGTIVAAADARWNTTYDGGGLDTIVSYSKDNGASWNYTFANYLGDNGNTYNGSSSTAFIDPALATDGTNVYMLCDLYPYGVALNGSGNTAPSTDVGFNSDGKLLLSADGTNYNYYLDGTVIKDSSGSEIADYTVDDYFNITGTDGTSSNLFFSDSPYKVVRTGYLYLTKSTDGEKTWSEPTLIPDVKTSSEQVCLVGPGRGLVTGGKIIFPVYSYNGSSSSQQMGFIYSSDGGATWSRSANFTGDSWSSEAAVVGLSDGTLRFFYRNGNSKLYYADYTWGTGWGNAVNTGIATNSNTQISAISYSKTVGGKQVILVSCPTGSGSSGSADSSASARLNGKIFVGLVNSDKTMDWQSDKAISVTSNNNQFMYSCLTELSDGSVAILYEDNESGWGTGYYYQMSFATYENTNFGLTFDAASEPEDGTVTDNNTGVSVSFGSAVSSMTVEKAEPAILSGRDYVAFDITVEGFSGNATVTIPLGGKFTADEKLYAAYIADGKIVERIDGTFDSVADTFTFVTNHFSTYAVLSASDDASDAVTPVDISLTVDEIKVVTDTTGYYTTFVADPEGIVSVVLTGEAGQEGGVTYTKASVTCNTLISSNSNSWTRADSYYYTPDGTNYYPVYAKRSSSWSWSSWSYTYTYTWGYSTTSSTGNVTQIGTQSTTSTGTTPNITVYTQTTTETVDPYTTITFTALKAGTTTVTVGDTAYNITVTRKTETVNLAVGGSVSYDDAGTGTPVVANSTIATATLSSGKLTITGVAAGTTTITTDTTVYTVNVSDGTPISIKENETTTISVTLNDGQYVKWSSANSNYAGVAGKYDTDAKAYTNEAILAGQNMTDSPVVVTATIYNADGTVAGTQKWLVTVTEGDKTGEKKTVTLKFDIAKLQNCTLYYCINGGELVEIKKEDLRTETDSNGNTYYYLDAVINNTYTNYGHGVNISFFAAPDEGYALTYMAYKPIGTADQYQYFTISDGNPDGTGSEAWPFDKATQNTIPSSSAADEWKNQDDYYGIIGGVSKDSHNCFGYGWALHEGNMTIDQWKVMMSTAIALGCDGAQLFTKNTNGTNFEADLTFVAQKLPTVEKTITSITRGGTNNTYTDGMKVELGDTINYSVVVTRYATNSSYGTITYEKEKLTDELTNSSFTPNTTPDLGTSNSTSSTYTYTTSLTLTMGNFADVVKDGKITNTVDFSYSYSSQYSSGSLKSEASAVADITVSVPEYVIDFGLPVIINLSKELGNATISEGMATYGVITANGTSSFTYTPNTILQGVDHITLKLSNNQSYGVNIYPATTVYYEEGFLNGDTTSTRYQSPVKLGSEKLGSAENIYGYDEVYINDRASSNGTYITSSNDDLATFTFTFTGTGFELYANSDASSGYVTVYSKGELSKLYMINTVLSNGTTAATIQQTGGTYYSLPIISETDLPFGTYTVQIKQTNVDANVDAHIYIDGVRIINTLQDSSVFIYDKEDNPVFYELRDYVLNAIGVESINKSDYIDSNDRSGMVDNVKDMAGQVYTALGDNSKAILVNKEGTSFTPAQAQDLLDNGPKNELYLYPGQTLAFSVTTNRVMQLGLKSPTGSAKFTLTVKDGTNITKLEPSSLSTTVDMFYKIAGKATSETTYTVSINVSEGVLSVTKLKVCDDPNFTFNALTETDITNVLLNLYGFGDEIITDETPEEPETPAVIYADACLDVTVTSMFGRKLGTVTLTANGAEGETHIFTSDEILEAVKTKFNKNYIPVGDSALSNAVVKYGETIEVELQEYLDIIPMFDFDIDFDRWKDHWIDKESKNYTITASAGEGGSISNEGDKVVKFNGNITYNFTPDKGYEVLSVVVDGKDMGAISKYTFKNVRDDHTISVEFCEEVKHDNGKNDKDDRNDKNDKNNKNNKNNQIQFDDWFERTKWLEEFLRYLGKH